MLIPSETPTFDLKSCQMEFWMLKTSKNQSTAYSGDLKSDHLKSWNIWNLDFFGGRISNGQDLAINHSKSGCFFRILNGFLTKWRPFVRISNSWASGFQIPFKIRTSCNPTSFWPLKFQTNPDFRSPLYSHFKSRNKILIKYPTSQTSNSTWETLFNEHQTEIALQNRYWQHCCGFIWHLANCFLLWRWINLKIFSQFYWSFPTILLLFLQVG